VCAKAALEGFMRGLARECPALRFVIARLPRIRTDQTNAPFSLEPLADAVQVAKRLVTALDDLPAAGLNLHEIQIER
jgi:hypothetical protein